MDARMKKLLAFLSGNLQLIVPVYQRPYSWKQQHCEQLWDDILRAGHNKKEANHFIGSIVHISNVHSFSGLSKMLLIDGQQRITTITLLLLAIKKLLGDKRIEGQDPRAFLDNPRSKGEAKYKLLLSKVDKDTLLRLLDNPDQPLKQMSGTLVDNFSYFSRLLSDASGAGELEAIWRGIGRLSIVEISLDRDKDNPQLIFESMNSTGKDLSQADLIRNYVLMGVELDRQAALYEEYWYPMELKFGDDYNEHFDNFVRHFLCVKIKGRPSQKKVYEEFKRYHASDRCIGDTEEILKDMLKHSEFYCRIALGKEEDPGLKAVFSEFSDNLTADVALPFLLHAYDHYDMGELDKSSFEKIVRLVISYVFRRFICKLQTSAIGPTFEKLLVSTQNGLSVDSVEGFFRGLANSQSRFPCNLEFIGHLCNSGIYKIGFRKYLLEKLENHNRKEKISVKEYEVDLIMPDSPTYEWREELGENATSICERYAFNLGNLTLVSYDSSHKHKSFKEKRDMKDGFADSRLYLNSYLRSCDTWGEEAIQERVKQLAKRASEVWETPSELEEKLTSASLNEAYSVDNKFARSNARPIYDALLGELSMLGNVMESPKKCYISICLSGRKIADVDVLTNYLNVSFKANIGEIDDPRSKIRDMSRTGHMGTGNAMVVIDSTDDIPYLMDILKQAFNQKI